MQNCNDGQTPFKRDCGWLDSFFTVQFVSYPRKSSTVIKLSPVLSSLLKAFMIISLRDLLIGGWERRSTRYKSLSLLPHSLSLFLSLSLSITFFKPTLKCLRNSSKLIDLLPSVSNLLNRALISYTAQKNRLMGIYMHMHQ